MNEEMQAKLEELCKDEEYVRYIFSLDSAEAISEELKTKGVELSVDEIHQIGDILRKKANGDLNDEELEKIYGGTSFLGFLGLVVIVGVVYVGCRHLSGKRCS